MVLAEKTPASADEPVALIGLLNSGTLRIDRVLEVGEAITARTICDMLFFTDTVETYELSDRELWRILRKSVELRSAGGAEGHGDFLQLSGLKALHTEGALTGVVLTGNGPERDLLEDDRVWLVATTHYVASISKQYAHNPVASSRHHAVSVGDDPAYRQIPALLSFNGLLNSKRHILRIIVYCHVALLPPR